MSKGIWFCPKAPGLLSRFIEVDRKQRRMHFFNNFQIYLVVRNYKRGINQGNAPLDSLWKRKEKKYLKGFCNKNSNTKLSEDKLLPFAITWYHSSFSVTVFKNPTIMRFQHLTGRNTDWGCSWHSCMLVSQGELWLLHLQDPPRVEDHEQESSIHLRAGKGISATRPAILTRIHLN